MSNNDKTQLISKKYNSWLDACKSQPELYAELERICDDNEKISDRFYCELAFGTGGLRGVLGAGTNRMNVFTVAKATDGLAKYLLSQTKNASVVIAYDSRHMSAEFARIAAEVFSSFKIKAYLFSELTPTPVLSFAVRKLQATAGIVVTASHNPKEYNGYKVYNSKGCQITEKAAAAITDYISKTPYFVAYKPNESLIEALNGDVVNDFLNEIQNYSYFDKTAEYAPSVVYTPLNGTGNKPVREILKRIGARSVFVVPEQELPDGDFPTCPYPNPEERAALNKALELASEKGAELVIATDPDADRVGVAVRLSNGTYCLLNGNETGVIIENYLLRAKKERGELTPNSRVVKTIVTSDMATDIANAYGVGAVDVLTGFKYIGETIDRLARPEDYVFGMEESYGYLVGVHARDKDAVSAVMIIVETAAYYRSLGKTLNDVIEELYSEYGYYGTSLISKTFSGEKGKGEMQSFIAAIRKNPWQTVCGLKCVLKDYAGGIDGLPPSNVLAFKGDDFKIILRPSGTEPKIKFYLTAKRETRAESDELLCKLEDFIEGLFRIN